MPRGSAAWLVLSCLLTACFAGTGGTRGDPPPEVRRVNQPEAGSINVYLETMRNLAHGDLAQQAEVFQQVNLAYLASPTTVNRLNLALALGTPGHASSDPIESQRMLLELLATPEVMLPAERALAEIHLKEVEERLVLRVENERLQRDSLRDQRAEADANARRLRAVMDENTSLRRALNEAQQKLNAVTSIERSIIERTENGTARDNDERQ